MKIWSHQAVPKRDLSATPASTFATFAAISGVAALLIAGLFVTTQPAAAQQGFGNFFSYQGAPRKRVVKKRRAPDAETTAKKTDPAKKEAAEKTGPKASGLRRRLAVRSARHGLRQHRPHRALARVDRSGWSPYADGRVQRHRQGTLAPLEHLLRRADAVDAAHHLVGRRHARWASCRAIRPRTVASASRPASRRSSTA